MNNPALVRLSGLLVFLISVGSLAAALYLQVNKDWFPCPLCIIQRYAYLGTAILGVIVMLRTTEKRARASRLFPLLMGLTAVAGVGVAFYHLWVLAGPKQTCGVDPIQDWLNSLPWVSYWWVMFEADGLCTEEYPPLYGLSLPAWSALGLGAQVVLSWVGLRAARPISVFKA